MAFARRRIDEQPINGSAHEAKSVGRRGHSIRATMAEHDPTITTCVEQR
jgi:hypothetical protein